MTVCAAERCKLPGDRVCPTCERTLCSNRHLQDGWDECLDCRRAHTSTSVCATPECTKSSIALCPQCSRWHCKTHHGRPTVEACIACLPEQIRGGGDGPAE